MKILTIDRIEGIYAICTEKTDKPRKEKDRKYFGILVSELPKGASAGDTVTVDDDTGTLNLEKAARKA